MILIDSHIHSKYSFDSVAEPQDMIESAIEKNIKCLCFTEHLDINMLNEAENFEAKFDAYFLELQALRKTYSDKIEIIIGLEAGFNSYNQAIFDLIEKYPFEYVINSVHEKGFDYFSSDMYKHREKYSVYEEYLQTVYNSLFAPYRFDTIGHLGFPSRAAPYDDNAWYFNSHKSTFTKLLQKIIELGTVLEVNTNVYRSAHPFLPCDEVLSQYYKMGGRYITFSSDAHRPQTLGNNYQKTVEQLKNIGFTHLTKCKNGKKELLNL